MSIMTTRRLVLYPRGFMGAPQPARIERAPTDAEKRFNTVQGPNLTVTLRSGVNTVVTNDDVDELYRAHIDRVGMLNSYEFRKKLLKAALKAFGTLSFEHWYRQQITSPAFGDLHSKFLDDTLIFITTGKRQQHMLTWTSLLDYSDADVEETKMSAVAHEFFGVSANGITRERRNDRLEEVIQRWVSQPGGFDDLLCSLHILFGRL